MPGTAVGRRAAFQCSRSTDSARPGERASTCAASDRSWPIPRWLVNRGSSASRAAWVKVPPRQQRVHRAERRPRRQQPAEVERGAQRRGHPDARRSRPRRAPSETSPSAERGARGPPGGEHVERHRITPAGQRAVHPRSGPVDHDRPAADERERRAAARKRRESRRGRRRRRPRAAPAGPALPHHPLQERTLDADRARPSQA